MTAIRFDAGTKIVIDGNKFTVAPAGGSVGSCGGGTTGGGTTVAGVSAIEVGAVRLTGDVELASGEGASLAVAGNRVTIAAQAANRLRDLLDVAITTDANGNPIIPDGSLLRFDAFEDSSLGVWVANPTLDGGGY